jgi:hypothetical protein
MPQGLGFAKHGSDLAAVVAAEVAANTLTEIGCFADVQHFITLTAEHVHPGSTGQAGSHLELRRLRMPGEFRQCNKIVEA